MDTDTIVNGIYGGTFTPDDLKRISEALRHVSRRAEATAKRSFRVGQRVWWVTDRLGRVDGVVTKIGRRNIYTQTNVGAKWRVNPALLSPA